MRADAKLVVKNEGMRLKRQLEGRIIRSWVTNRKSGEGKENNEGKGILWADSRHSGWADGAGGTPWRNKQTQGQELIWE